MYKYIKEISIILISMLPVIELRGAIPIGISLGFSPFKSLILSIVGNILIIPIILNILVPTMDWLEKTDIFKSTIGWIKNRALSKTKKTIKKYSTIGLFLFVAIPLPTTGVWTGSVAASLLKLDYKKSIITMSLGVMVSGTIVYLLSKNII